MGSTQISLILQSILYVVWTSDINAWTPDGLVL